MTEPRILLWDLETTPNIGATWGKWDQNVLWFEKPWYILCVGWKWLDEPEAHVFGIDDCPDSLAWDDDSMVVKRIHALLEEADVIVAHNGDKFDEPKARARMIVHGMTPPRPYSRVDTLKIARKEFQFTSNKLGDVASVLGLPEQKGDPGGLMSWKGCMDGDPEAWTRMKSYCKQDILTLEQVYLRLRPWSARHPNLATISDRPNVCPKCGEDKGFVSRGWQNNAVTRCRQYRCNACGGYVQGRQVTKSPALFKI